jgi:hypothetical protein
MPFRFRYVLLIIPLLGAVSAVVTGCGGRADEYIQADDAQAQADNGYGYYGYGYGYGYR